MRIILSLFLLLAIIISIFMIRKGYSADSCDLYYDVTVTSSGILGLDIERSRKYTRFINPTIYEIRASSIPITSATYLNNSIIIPAVIVGGRFGEYEDRYWVHKGSWYFCSTGTVSGAIINILEKQ